jgi:RNA polymerase subunit RPABC4/transcription elongation factor Spt4
MFEINEGVLLGAAVYGGVILAVFWLALVLWTWRDMKSRSRDGLARLLVTLLVAVLNVPGVFIYILLRPRETLSEAYERSLEEEALLQEIEEKPACPGCGQRVQMQWQVCPACHTRLKKPCRTCHNLLELSWDVCPVCASAQPAYMPQDEVVNSSRHVQRQAPRSPQTPGGVPDIPDKWLAPSARQPRSTQRPTSSTDYPTEQPGFVDDNTAY